jgi:hypothetical protein
MSGVSTTLFIPDGAFDETSELAILPGATITLRSRFTANATSWERHEAG